MERLKNIERKVAKLIQSGKTLYQDRENLRERVLELENLLHHKDQIIKELNNIVVFNKTKIENLTSEKLLAADHVENIIHDLDELQEA